MSNKITMLPEYIDIVQKTSIDFYRDGTNLLNVFGSYLGQLATSIDLEKSKSSADIVANTVNVYKELNNSNFKRVVDGSEYDFDQVFKLHFIEKFQSLSDTLKSLIRDSLGTDNVYFINYSDDIGILTNDTSIVDNSTSPFFDIYDDLFVYPNALPASLYNRVSQNEKSNSIKTSLYTDALMKTNLRGLQGDVNINTAKTAHGENLVNDTPYIDRVYLSKEQIKSRLRLILKDMASFIDFFKNVNFRDQDPDRKAVPAVYKAELEGVINTIDFLQNRV